MTFAFADKESTTYRSESELIELVRDFENCTLPHSEWNHAAHLAVAAWYLTHLDEPVATERIIAGIQKYNRSNGIPMTPRGGYHETMTLFWIAIVRQYLVCHPWRSIVRRINGLVDAYGNQGKLFLEYYSRERIMSWRARLSWLEPDLKPLEVFSARGRLTAVPGS